MSDEYTPTTEEIRADFGYRTSRLWHIDEGEQGTVHALAEFDRWLAAHDAETVRVTAEKAIRAVEENAGEADESGICEGVSGWRNKERASAYSLGVLEAVDSIREEFGLAPDEKGGA